MVKNTTVFGAVAFLVRNWEINDKKIPNNYLVQKTSSGQGYWTQHYIWRSGRHSQERRTCRQGRPSKKKTFFLRLQSPKMQDSSRCLHTPEPRNFPKSVKKVLKGPSRTKSTTDSKFTIRSKFATAIVKHYGGHFETTIFKGKLSSKSLQIVKNYGSSKTLRN